MADMFGALIFGQPPGGLAVQVWENLVRLNGSWCCMRPNWVSTSTATTTSASRRTRGTFLTTSTRSAGRTVVAGAAVASERSSVRP